jgi:hypothetical protein
MQHPNLSDHARHDTTLIAGHAAGDLTDIDRARADALLADCGSCVELRRDLVAIAAATRSVPAPATLTRDLRLAPEQADRLRRGSWLRTLLRPFGAAGSPVRPMATAFTSLGLVGLVVGVTLSSGVGLSGAGTSGDSLDREGALAPAATSARAAPAATTYDAAVEGYAVPIVRASDGTLYQAVRASDGTYYLATTIPRTALDGMRSAKPTGEEPAPTEGALGAYQGGRPLGVGPSGDNDGSTDRLAAESPPNPLIAGSLALLGIGLLLFGLRLASTRVR